MSVTNRKQALKMGLRVYFTGKPCKHGHVSPRYINTGQCTACAQQEDSKRLQNRDPLGRSRMLDIDHRIEQMAMERMDDAYYHMDL